MLFKYDSYWIPTTTQSKPWITDTALGIMIMSRNAQLHSKNEIKSLNPYIDIQGFRKPVEKEIKR